MESASCFSTSSSRQEVHSCRSSTLFFFSVLWFCHSVTVSIYTQRYGDIIGQRGTETYAQIHMNYITWAYSCTSMYTRQWSAPWDQSYLCFYVLCVLVFFTPPVAMYHHYLSVLEPVLSADSLEEKIRAKSASLVVRLLGRSRKRYICAAF